MVCDKDVGFKYPKDVFSIIHTETVKAATIHKARKKDTVTHPVNCEDEDRELILKGDERRLRMTWLPHGQIPNS